MTRSAVFLVLSGFVAAGIPGYAAERATIHVAPTGDDAASGASDAPVKSLERAQALVRERFNDAPPKQIDVRFSPGTYELSRTWAFTAVDNPPPGTTVIYSGPLTGEPAVISGGRTLGKWRVANDRWQIDIPAAQDGQWAFRDLYINGARRTRARTPNQGYFRVEKAGEDRRTNFTFAQGDLQPIAAPTAAEIVFLHDWSISRMPIAGIDSASRTIRFTDPIGNAAPHYAIDHFEAHPRYFLEGAPEFLDAPGEWHLDAQGGVLTYIPLPGEEPAKSVAIAPRLEQLLTITGEEQRKQSVRNTHFVGLQFAFTHWPLPKGGYAGSQASFHEDRTHVHDPSQANRKPPRVMVPAAILCDLADGIAFQQCRFTHFGGSGLYLRRECVHCLVDESVFEDIGANGMMIGETFTRPAAEPDGAPLVSADDRVTRCVITRCGELDYGAVGIWVGIARDVQIAGNELSHLPYTGISVGWKWDNSPTGVARIVVEKNHIHHVLQKMSDGGGIYTLGRQPGSILRLNQIHDIPVNAGRAESNGIFMDEGSSEILVDNNTIYNIAKSPIRFHKAAGVTLRNNRLVSAPGVPAVRYVNSQEQTMTLTDNQLLEANTWQPPANDPAANSGPQP
jgi:hypothetical protein